MDQEVFSRIINDTAGTDEKSDFYLKLNEDNKLREKYCHYKNIYVLSRFKHDTYNELSKVSFERFWKSCNPVKRQNLFTIWTKYAALFLLALTSGYILRNITDKVKSPESRSQHIEYQSEKGSFSMVRLNDGSKIWLNSKTRLTIDEKKSGEMVAQLDGEAYFEMVPDPLRSFTVDLGNLKVKDIGTTFNIRAYKNEQQISTLLVSGKIELSDKSNKKLLSMNQGEYVQFNKQNDSLLSMKVDPSYITAWKEGRFVFIDMSLAQICHELGNWYDVEFIVTDSALANTHYTSIIKRTTTVNHVLKVLSFTDHINYQIINKKEGKDLIIIEK